MDDGKNGAPPKLMQSLNSMQCRIVALPDLPVRHVRQAFVRSRPTSAVLT